MGQTLFGPEDAETRYLKGCLPSGEPAQTFGTVASRKLIESGVLASGPAPDSYIQHSISTLSHTFPRPYCTCLGEHS